MTWLGRAEALVATSGDVAALAEFTLAKPKLAQPTTRAMAQQSLMLTLYKVLAAAELASPPGAQGAFIPVGSSFDAYAAIAKVMSAAKHDVLVVDPYMDDTVLIDFGGVLNEGVTLRLLTDQATARPNLAPAASRWKAQFDRRPLEVRLASQKALHDRAIFIDRSEAWTVTQSLKDFAKRSPAEIVRADDIASLKIASYESIWLNSTIVV
ncbi:phosphatidylserine/phosphatidylglycerophosphate/cardiolipin synthase family protein [Bradyrhizobium sp. BR 10289]|uniref:phosphatidylserine/phosphatidylglycerophosphate/ cardiolipin synthase family protein n=1 Tax=Bradyrhizobium sp. BR 10289 TaxID=2749993 RepID=UPI001C64E23A|nr:phosphatidylserine/phosphatidylglycerophosphate/cardiolipin synthase family protein [Bradyrhizobium sp. BR 10289]MBW7968408.1 phosphatidylserine/phosphatidylglycerophosphate/cardiolipin synthase family protein [Bradyrhizobium sp. BR 10289]